MAISSDYRDSHAMADLKWTESCCEKAHEQQGLQPKQSPGLDV